MTEESNENALNAMTLVQAAPAMMALSEEAREPFLQLFEQMTSVPEGMENDNATWRPERIKILTGTTTDPGVPGDAKKGDIWVNGETLWSTTDGPGQPWLFVPVYHWQSRVRFAPDDQVPSCSSMDSKWNMMGTKQCDTCEDFPFRNGVPTPCNNVHNFIVVPIDLSGVYEISFSKTSFQAGTNILKIMRTKKTLWEVPLGLTTTERQKGSNKWHVYNTATFAKTPMPEGLDDFARFVSGEVKKGRDGLLDALEKKREFVAETLAGGGVIEGTSIGAEEEGFSDMM
jgi:hypothetical protein